MRIGVIIIALVLAFVAFAWPLPPYVHADDDKDHDKARRVLENKEILRLDEVLAKVRAEMPGDIIDVELEQEDSVWVYEFKLIDPSGKVKKVVADAKSGAIIKRKRK